jgi:protein-tyrosine phosphatase
MNLDQVLPCLYLGSCPCCINDVDELKQLGVTAVLNVQTDEDFNYWGIDWGSVESHYAAAGIELRRHPIRDFEPTDLARNLPTCVRALDELLRAGHTVYVHCSAGINRSPSAVIAYLHWVQGRSLTDAIAGVTRCRACDPYVDAIEDASVEWRRGARPS